SSRDRFLIRLACSLVRFRIRAMQLLTSDISRELVRDTTASLPTAHARCGAVPAATTWASTRRAMANTSRARSASRPQDATSQWLARMRAIAVSTQPEDGSGRLERAQETVREREAARERGPGGLTHGAVDAAADRTAAHDRVADDDLDAGRSDRRSGRPDRGARSGAVG